MEYITCWRACLWQGAKVTTGSREAAQQVLDSWGKGHLEYKTVASTDWRPEDYNTARRESSG